MKKIEKIQNRIEKIESILSEVKLELKELEENSYKEKSRKYKEKFPTPEVFIKEYEDLYSNFLRENSKVVLDFIDVRSLKYLLKFCQSNNIVIDSKKRSKSKIGEEIIQWFIQRKAITKKI